MKFLPQAKKLLSPTGVIYLLLIEENLPLLPMLGKEEIRMSWTVMVKNELMRGGEKQFVVRLEQL